ncbi:MAG: pyridoxamine 5'-phosphate oxidase family protein [Mycolicibacterium neoaurum]|uniref:pyridoxamine 5'-phosphate oxidase family protein n=1 Tax=Mycolicibacterium neoaurum TaxID=1795 RepID=UPI002FF7AC49
MGPVSALTAADIALLRRPLYGFLTVAGGPDPAQPRPVWYEYADDGTIGLFTEARSVKVRRLRREARASLVVTAPVGEREHWVSVAGSVDIHTAGASELAARLAARYWDLQDPIRTQELAAMQSVELLRLVIHPDTITRYAMG